MAFFGLVDPEVAELNARKKTLKQRRNNCLHIIEVKRTLQSRYMERQKQEPGDTTWQDRAGFAQQAATDEANRVMCLGQELQDVERRLVLRKEALSGWQTFGVSAAFYTMGQLLVPHSMHLACV